MKKIYLILTHTGTPLANFIRFYTKDEFSHVSIALDSELQEMYSFGRLNPYNAFIGGFVHEYIDKGTFKRFKNTYARIYSMDIEDEKYDLLEQNIRKFQEKKDIYGFNIIGMFAVGLNKKIKFDKALYCAEFVKQMMDESQIENNLPEIVKPENFKDLEGLEEIYTGKLREYNL